MLKYGAESRTSKVWQTLQTCESLILGPLFTVLDKQDGQKIRPQCLQWSYKIKISLNTEEHQNYKFFFINFKFISVLL